MIVIKVCAETKYQFGYLSLCTMSTKCQLYNTDL